MHRSSHHVFLAAVSYLDTALASLQDNTRSPPDLQCLAAACLCLASKLLDPQPMSLSRFGRKNICCQLGKNKFA